MSELLIGYYGDDFSGSTDVMEVLAQAGVPTLLFLEAPTAADLTAHPELRAVGLAGVSRSLPTEQMEAVLRPAFTALDRLRPRLIHYKICSTFDSSPRVGNIGRAMDIGHTLFGGDCVPLVVGAPALGRYCLFGHLFASSGQDSPIYRLDRHPTMSRHPITPMHESDLRRLLAEQTARPVSLVDVLQLGGAHKPRENQVAGEIRLFDVLDSQHEQAIGEQLSELLEQQRPLFAAGSSGLEYALTACWRARGLLPAPPPFRAEPVEQIVVVSGSCSPVTARQMDAALGHGFAEVTLVPDTWTSCRSGQGAEVAQEVLRLLNEGRSVLVHTAKGPDDPRIAGVRQHLREDETALHLGRFFGSILDRVWQQTKVQRVVVTGGDTSGYVARELGIRALAFRAPIAPGSPLCRIHAPNRAADGREILFKGGQVGKVDLFDLIRLGQKQL